MGLFGKMIGKSLGGVAGGLAGNLIGGKSGRKIGSQLGGQLGGAAGGLLGFKKGGRVKKTQVALVHAGEYVLPKGVKPTKGQVNKVNKGKMKK
jgi:uncharacterized membrane protein YebE (DUF533 family)